MTAIQLASPAEASNSGNEKNIGVTRTAIIHKIKLSSEVFSMVSAPFTAG